jgi:hypothetical protein
MLIAITIPVFQCKDFEIEEKTRIQQKSEGK